MISCRFKVRLKISLGLALGPNLYIQLHRAGVMIKFGARVRLQTGIWDRA